jgi:hypothetical protein
MAFHRSTSIVAQCPRQQGPSNRTEDNPNRNQNATPAGNHKSQSYQIGLNAIKALPQATDFIV